MAVTRTVASLDIGSNTIVMLVADRVDGAWVQRHSEVHITRVAEGLDATGVLAAEPIARTRKALEACVAKAKALGATAYLATGTAPFRRASNGADIARSLGETLGFPLDVVSGADEARLSLLATTASFPDIEHLAVVDIGGASTEVILLDQPEGVPDLVSLDIGSVRLSERCLHHDPATPVEIAALQLAIAEALSGCALRPRDMSPWTLVGVAGTVTTMAAHQLGMTEYDGERIHGHRMSVDWLRQSVERFSSLSTRERARLVGVAPKRADVIGTGASILLAVAEAAGVAEIVVSDRGTQWGRLFEIHGV